MAAETPVLDASTAILLAKAGLLETVVGAGETCMTETAFKEATAKRTHDALLIGRLAGDGLIRKASIKAGVSVLQRDFRLDKGEAETILAAKGKDATCATDDGPAIRCCKVLGIPFATAVGFLVALCERGRVEGELGEELLAKLETYGRYDSRILADAARRIRDSGSKGEKK